MSFSALRHHAVLLWTGPAISFASIASAGEIDPTKLPPAAASADFEKDVKPLLQSVCVGCHGEEKQKGKFRIDTREGLIKGGENGKAIVLGDSAKSPLIHYVTRLVEDFEMPPKKEQALKPEQIALLRKWIDQGASWPDGVKLVAQKTGEEKRREHWAFKAPVRPQPAGIADWQSRIVDWEKRDPRLGAQLRTEQPRIEAWSRNPIDSFVLDRLLREGLTPSPEAPPETLCRRLYLDLTGLPPSPEELDTFLKSAISNQQPSGARQPERSGDSLAYFNPTRPRQTATGSPEGKRGGAYQSAIGELVERLLASPHYGERWGRFWLDAARYADSDGYEKDKPRFAYFYRDWVVNAFNRDEPYDQFIIDQLAGDQLPNATQDQIVATGFLRNSMLNEEGGVDPEQFRMEAMFDRMEALGKTVLGLTIQCTQCHDHKYDPLTQEEYYQVFAFLNNDHEAQPVVYTPEEQKKRHDVLRQIRDAEAMLKSSHPDYQERLAKWEDELKAQPEPQWTIIQPAVEEISTGGQRYLPQQDGSFIAAGYQPTKHEVKMTIKTNVQNIRAFRLEAMNDPNLPANGPGRSHLGTFGLTEFKVETTAAKPDAKPVTVKFAKAVADLEPPPETPVHPNFNEKAAVRRVIGPASYAIDGKDDTAWSNDLGPGRRNHECAAIFITEQPIANEGGTELTIRLSQKHGGWNSDDIQGNNLGRFRLAVTSTVPDDLERVPKRVREALAVPREQRTPAQTANIFSYWRTTVAEWKEANAKIDALWKEYPEGTTQLVLAARTEGRETHLLKRGDWLKPGEQVTAGVPAILHPLPADAAPTRLTFAKWLVDPKAPTTARVAVNRIWQTYFGTGLVSTPEDFGTQSEVPSHPELLDWLACEFMDRGWSMKAMHRLIVNSATYRQSSKVTPELYARDQYNRLLARGARFRMEGEGVRDIALAASGLLNRTLGGRPLMPPAPTFLFLPPASYAPFTWTEETGPDRYRRALYTYRRRSTPFPMLQVFDAPEGNNSCVRRARSNTPIQALMTLNETMSMEAAQALARRVLEQGGTSDTDRITYAFRRCVSRPPTDEERAELLRLLARQRARIAEGWVDSWQLATGKNEKPADIPASTTPAQLAAYTVVSRVLLNLDETITKE